MILGFIGVYYIAPYGITQPPRVKVSTTPNELGLISKTLVIETKDDIELRGYWIMSKTDTTKGIVILIHGIGGCKEHFLNLANELSKKGIASIVFDGRAHGQSGGKFCTYGFKEKMDVAQIVDKIKQQEPNLPIGVWGNSLGGAIAIQSLEYDNRIEFGIIESTFTDLNQIVYDYKRRILKGVGIRSVSDYALRRAGKIADFDPLQVSRLNPLVILNNQFYWPMEILT